MVPVTGHVKRKSEARAYHIINGPPATFKTVEAYGRSDLHVLLTLTSRDSVDVATSDDKRKKRSGHVRLIIGIFTEPA